MNARRRAIAATLTSWFAIGVCAAADLAASQQIVFRRALKNMAPSIVRIDTIGGAQPVQRDAAGAGVQTAAGFRQADGPTTGVVWTGDGYILTSSFNFVRDPVVITVTLADGRKLVARLVARDRWSRLALLKIDAEGLPTPERATVDALRPGQWTLAAGWGFGGSTPCMTAGVLSALRRSDGKAVQTDAKISPANYGGPLFDVEGRLIGICAPLGAGQDELAGVEWYDSGIGFAIRTDFIDARFEKFKQGDLYLGLLGVNLDTRDRIVGLEGETDAPSGLRIIEAPLGPAAEAGLQMDDVITAVDGTPTPRIVDFKRAVAVKSAGDTVHVEFLRGGERGETDVTLAPPRAFNRPRVDAP